MSAKTAPIDITATLQRDAEAPVAKGEVVFGINDLTVSYGSNLALSGVSLDIYKNLITAMIGPSGCGKSTFIRCLNRMNDLVPGVKVDGKILYHGQDLYGGDADPVEVRRRIGMVFQRPNPFPKSIYDNVAFAPKKLGRPGPMHERVEGALRGAALWDEVKDRLKKSALALSGGQQQRLCIARALAVEPEVILLDEPCSALDPIATAKVEELMLDLKSRYTLVIVTHNMQQATRVSDYTAFLYLGEMVEYEETQKLFINPAKKQTEDYITGRFG
jgi:phosphate transport system ATP-binding protein